MTNRLTEEIIAKLNPEQLKIALKWEQERLGREKLIDKLDANEISVSDFCDSIFLLTPELCEHDRSIWSNCIKCDEIERIINPNAFSDEEE